MDFEGRRQLVGEFYCGFPKRSPSGPSEGLGGIVRTDGEREGGSKIESQSGLTHSDTGNRQSTEEEGEAEGRA